MAGNERWGNALGRLGEVGTPAGEELERNGEGEGEPKAWLEPCGWREEEEVSDGVCVGGDDDLI